MPVANRPRERRSHAARGAAAWRAAVRCTRSRYHTSRSPRVLKQITHPTKMIVVDKHLEDCEILQFSSNKMKFYLYETKAHFWLTRFLFTHIYKQAYHFKIFNSRCLKNNKRNSLVSKKSSRKHLVPESTSNIVYRRNHHISPFYLYYSTTISNTCDNF